MKLIYRNIFVVIFFIILLPSCLEREELTVRDTEYISFIADLKQPGKPKAKSISSALSMDVEDWEIGLSTKVAVTNNLKGEAMVIGIQYEGDFDEQIHKPWTTLSECAFEFNGDVLLSPKPVRWSQLEKSKLNLYVYSPIPPEDGTIPGATMPDLSVAGTPKISYVLPPDRKDHTDIITAVKEVVTRSDNALFNKTVPLTFTHAFTGLKFKMGFPCTVKSITISGVFNKADYFIGKGWNNHQAVFHTGNSNEYTINFGEGKTVAADVHLFDDVMMMIPQTIPFGASDNPLIKVVYTETPGGTDKIIQASLKGHKWEESKLITYKLHKKESVDYIYFDLAAGNVTINNSTYLGHVYINGNVDTVWGYHHTANKYYVYQSSATTSDEFSSYQKGSTGYTSTADRTARKDCRVPAYDLVTYNGKLWSDFITNNTNVEEVIEVWDDGLNIKGSTATGEQRVGTAVVRDVGRTHTKNYIRVSGSNAIYDLTIDNIYSVDQDSESRNREKGGISYAPQGGTTLNVTILGDNRMGCLHICNNKTDFINIGGTGSLTVADTDFITKTGKGLSSTDYGDLVNYGYVSNYQNSAIGNNTYEGKENVYNLHINSGVIYAGTTKMDDCTAIGAGGNGYGEVNIHGGIVTAVSTTAGATIGGGMGHNASGGPGKVCIYGGNIYAYNFANRWNIASSAIGGGGSSGQEGSDGEVEITGGNIYAYSALGTGIGGGSSNNKKGGNAIINISGGYIVAKSGGANGIGGGNGGSGANMNGGTAIITITGTPIIRTGSIGGGKTASKTGKIGSADITITGGDIQAQFVMASGASSKPEFNMSGGTIRNSYTNDPEYIHMQKFGGAVYMDDGTFTMSGGKILNCFAENGGGAIYIKTISSTETESATESAFTMTGGTIADCMSNNNGGAVYMEGGTVTLSGGTIFNNLAQRGNGGGIYIKGGNFSMPEEGTASIEKNAANSNNQDGFGKGGGIYVTSSAGDLKVNLLSGSIKENTSDRRGGGIAVELSSDNASSTVTVGTLGTDAVPVIQKNRSSLSGGGLYVKGQNANIIMNGGVIENNITSGYVSNPDVANDGGMVTLNGGTVAHVDVTYLPNSEYAVVKDNAGNEVLSRSLVQKIVTATNNRISLPGSFERTNWEIYAWHTRQDYDDTKGRKYLPTDLLNLSSNITLYAMWREKVN